MNGRIRLRFLGFLLVVGFLLLPWSAPAKNIILLIRDGMGPGSERVNGLLHNTELFTIMQAALE